MTATGMSTKELARLVVRKLAPAVRAEMRLNRALRYQHAWLAERYLARLARRKRRRVTQRLVALDRVVDPRYGVDLPSLAGAWEVTHRGAVAIARQLEADGLVRVREDAFDARVWLTDLGLAVVRVCSRWEGR